jgi:hypothetical protein
MARSHPILPRRRESSRTFPLAILLAALVGWNAPDWIGRGANAPVTLLSLTSAVRGSAEQGSATYFPICGGGQRVTCVVDGDTFWLEGQKIRVADIDTPEISSPRCDAEFQRCSGSRATGQAWAKRWSARGWPSAMAAASRTGADRQIRARSALTRAPSGMSNSTRRCLKSIIMRLNWRRVLMPSSSAGVLSRPSSRNASASAKTIGT